MSYTILTEDLPYIGDLDPIDKKFLISKELIKIKGGRIYSKFVGEIITPHTKIFSLPKNIEDESLIEPIKKLLAKYKNEKGNLLFNNTFSLSKTGEFKSDLFFFKRLKSFFLDFVTYEFIYPLETTKVHSLEPQFGQIDMASTQINRKIYGDGITYDAINKKNDENWLLDDIYYHTLVELSESVGTTSERFEIKKMKEYLNEAGYEIRDSKKFLTYDQTLTEIKKCNVNIIHTPIKNTLIDYYNHKKLGSSEFKVNVFYTKNFEYVWEKIVQVALKHNPQSFGDLIPKFKKTIKHKDFVPHDQYDDFIKSNPNLKDIEFDPDDSNYITYKTYDAEPDVFSAGSSTYTTNLIDGKLKFIGDAKYYNNLKHDFHKEYSGYNAIQNNFYPMILLVPSDSTSIPLGGSKFGADKDDKRELLIIQISIEDIINDYIDGTNRVLSRIHALIRKRSKRVINQRKKI